MYIYFVHKYVWKLCTFWRQPLFPSRARYSSPNFWTARKPAHHTAISRSFCEHVTFEFFLRPNYCISKIRSVLAYFPRPLDPLFSWVSSPSAHSRVVYMICLIRQCPFRFLSSIFDFLGFEKIVKGTNKFIYLTVRTPKEDHSNRLLLISHFLFGRSPFPRSSIVWVEAYQSEML